MNYWKFPIFGFIMVFFFSCGKGDDSNNPGSDTINEDAEEIVVNADLTIKGNVTIFDEADDSSILYVDDNSITLQDNGQEFEIGDVIVAGISSNAPLGFLREIISIQSSGGELSLQTQQAKLTDAIKEGSATHSQTFDLTDFEKGASTDEQKFEVSLNLGENSPLSGSLSVIPTFIFDLSISNFQVQTARFGLEVDYTAQAVLNIVSEATSNLEKELIERDLKPITIFIGGIFPLVITPEFEVTAGLEYVGLNIATQYTLAGETSLILERVGGNWQTVKTNNENPSTVGISAALGDEFTSFIRPGLEISFYNLSQLETDFFIKKSITGKMIQNGENLGCEFNCALAVGGSVEIDIFGLEANPSIEATVVESDPFYECQDEVNSDRSFTAIVNGIPFIAYPIVTDGEDSLELKFYINRFKPDFFNNEETVSFDIGIIAFDALNSEVDWEVNNQRGITLSLYTYEDNFDFEDIVENQSYRSQEQWNSETGLNVLNGISIIRNGVTTGGADLLSSSITFTTIDRENQLLSGEFEMLSIVEGDDFTPVDIAVSEGKFNNIPYEIFD